jgi:hypothetical protein
MLLFVKKFAFLFPVTQQWAGIHRKFKIFLRTNLMDVRISFIPLFRSKSVIAIDCTIALKS